MKGGVNDADKEKEKTGEGDRRTDGGGGIGGVGGREETGRPGTSRRYEDVIEHRRRIPIQPSNFTSRAKPDTKRSDRDSEKVWPSFE